MGLFQLPYLGLIVLCGALEGLENAPRPVLLQLLILQLGLELRDHLLELQVLLLQGLILLLLVQLLLHLPYSGILSLKLPDDSLLYLLLAFLGHFQFLV